MWSRCRSQGGIGRYLQPDPIGLQPCEINLYLYARGNPIAFVDPMGLYSEMCFRDIDHMPPSAQHCYVRRDGDPSSTTSYWAEKPVDSTPHVTGDLHLNYPAPCQKIRGPEDVCEKDFDNCIDEDEGVRIDYLQYQDVQLLFLR